MNKLNFKVLMLTLLCILGYSTSAQALNVKQFKKACSASEPAHQQFCNTYLGGALDAIAVLNDNAKTNGDSLIYCKHEKELFLAPKIIAYVRALDKKWDTKNAVLPVIDYLKHAGGCRDKQ